MINLYNIMKKYLFLWLVMLMGGWHMSAQTSTDGALIRISTDETDLIYKQAPNGRLYQAYLGPALLQIGRAHV